MRQNIACTVSRDVLHWTHALGVSAKGNQTTKSQLKQIERAVSLRHVDPRYAAATCAVLHRSANSKTQGEIEQIMRLNCLLPQHATRLPNGCIVEAA